MGKQFLFQEEVTKMGMLSDIQEGIETFLSGIFKSAIKWEFSTISDTITSTVADTDSTDDFSIGSLVSDFLTVHPAKFGGAKANTPYSLWNLIESICDNAIVPIGGFILTIILLGDLYQMLMRGNNFKDFDDTIFIKWIIKCLCGILLISNVYYIASALFSFGTSAVSEGIATLFNSSIGTASLNTSALDNLELAELLMIMMIGALVTIAVVVMMVCIIVTMAGRIIEIFMYFSIGPIPMATMMSDSEWSSVGKNWIRQILALSFQGFFIVIALGIFKDLFNSAITSVNAGSSVLNSMILLMGYSLALCATILRTGSISKSVFNAH